MAAVNIPITSVAPDSTKIVNLQNLIDGAVPNAVSYVGIELEYDTPRGSVVASLMSTSENGEHVFQVPMFDPEKTPTSAGGYPWKADGDHSTLVYVKNETDEPKKFTAYLTYEGGSYALGMKEIKPHQTVAIDFRRIRDDQTPDANGNLIPPTADKGQISWSVRGNANNKLSGRSEQISISGGTSLTYDCRNCCPDEYYDSWIVPWTVDTTVGDFSTFTANQQDINCYGLLQQFYPIPTASWQSTVPTVADFDTNGLVESKSPGTSMIQASWLADIYDNELPEYCFWDQIFISREAPIGVSPPCVYPVNFQQVGNGTDMGNGVLRFIYSWESSNSVLADLHQCSVGEIVTYTGSNPYQPPSPPFPLNNQPNPNIEDLTATAGGFMDNHQTGGTFVPPYSSSSYTATQYYRYKCPCSSGGNYVNLLGPISIVRAVSPGSGSQWKYTITKSGSSATINPLP